MVAAQCIAVKPASYVTQICFAVLQPIESGVLLPCSLHQRAMLSYVAAAAAALRHAYVNFAWCMCSKKLKQKHNNLRATPLLQLQLGRQQYLDTTKEKPCSHLLLAEFSSTPLTRWQWLLCFTFVFCCFFVYFSWTRKSKFPQSSMTTTRLNAIQARNMPANCLCAAREFIKSVM